MNPDNEVQAGSFPVQDAHVHCYPETVIADPGRWAREMGESHWLNLVTNGPQGWAGPEDFLRIMDRDGVEKVLLQAWYWENPESARRQNEWHAEWVARHPDRFMACACIHPDLADPIGELETARGWGAVAVGECLPQVQDPKGWKHPAWNAVIEWTTRAGWPLCIHVTEAAGHDYPGKVETPLSELLGMFERHPDQKWLCAHWGGGLPFYAMNKSVRSTLHNVWFESAAGPLLYDSRIWQLAVELVGAEKVVFGSDFPLRLYPAKEREPGWGRFLEAFRESGLTGEELAMVASTNLTSLVGG